MGDEFGRIHIEPAHRVVAECVRARVYAEPEHREAVDVKCDDFDGVTFYICVLPEQRDVLRISIFTPCFDQIQAMVGDAYFRDLYAEVGAAIDTPQPQYSMTVAVNLDTFVATNANDAQRGERDGVCEDANVSPATPVSRLVPPALTFPRPASPFACTPHSRCGSHSA